MTKGLIIKIKAGESIFINGALVAAEGNVRLRFLNHARILPLKFMTEESDTDVNEIKVVAQNAIMHEWPETYVRERIEEVLDRGDIDKDTCASIRQMIRTNAWLQIIFSLSSQRE